MKRGRVQFDSIDADCQREDRFLAEVGLGDYREGLKREDRKKKRAGNVAERVSCMPHISVGYQVGCDRCARVTRMCSE